MLLVFSGGALLALLVISLRDKSLSDKSAQDAHNKRSGPVVHTFMTGIVDALYWLVRPWRSWSPGLGTDRARSIYDVVSAFFFGPPLQPPPGLQPPLGQQPPSGQVSPGRWPRTGNSAGENAAVAAANALSLSFGLFALWANITTGKLGHLFDSVPWAALPREGVPWAFGILPTLLAGGLFVWLIGRLLRRTFSHGRS